MKKKFFIPACLLYFFLYFAAAEGGTGLKQYQTFSWEPVTNAKKYEVTVQRKEADATWTEAADEKTADCHIEMLLDPGIYRVAISAFNVLGKKASSSSQVEFVILDETEPYLFDDIFETDKSVKSPVLHLKYPESKSAELVAAVSETGSQPAAPAAAEIPVIPEDPVNSFTLKGKNIYFPDTQFILVPADKGPDGSKPFPSYAENRTEVVLDIVRRDREKDSVVVSYVPEKLASGYYTLEVRNPGSKTTSSSVLILADKPPVIADTGFAYDNRYKVHTVSLERSSDAAFSISGKNFEYDTQFSLIPSEGIPYPFASSKQRHLISLTVKNHSTGADGMMQLDFSFDYEDLETGYYQLTAETHGMSSVMEQLLITVTNSTAAFPDIEKIKTKYDRKKQIITFTASGTNLDKAISGNLVSSWSDDIKDNNRIPLQIKGSDKNGKSLVFMIPDTGITAGTYALFFETENASVVRYITLNKSFSAALCTLADKEIARLFLRPEELAAPEIPAIPAAHSFTESALSVRDVSDWDHNQCREMVTDQGRLYLTAAALMAGYTQNTEPAAAGILRSGDTIRFKVTEKSAAGCWEIYLLLKNEKNEDCQLKFDMGISRYRRKKNGYYLYEIPYFAFKHINFTPKAKNFSPSLITGVMLKCSGYSAYYLKNGKNIGDTSNMYLELYDITVYSTGLQKNGSVITAEGKKIIKTDPVILPYAGIRASLDSEQERNITASDKFFDCTKMTYGLELRLLDFGWVSLDSAGYRNFYTKRWGADGCVRLAVPNAYFKPYIGTGFGATFTDSMSKDELYIPFYAGVTLFRFFDMRFTETLWNPDTSDSSSMDRQMSNPRYFRDSISVGILFRIRPARRVTVDTGAKK